MKAVTTPEFFNEPFHSAVQWMSEDSSPVFMRQLQYWPTVPWDNRGGRVTLAGDAAHCLLPSRSTLSPFELPRRLLTANAKIAAKASTRR